MPNANICYLLYLTYQCTTPYFLPLPSHDAHLPVALQGLQDIGSPPIGVAGYPLAVAVRTSARAMAARAGIVAVLVARKLPVCVRVYRATRGAGARRPRRRTALDIIGFGLEKAVEVGLGHGNVENSGVQMDPHAAPIFGNGNQRLAGDDIDLCTELPEALLNRIHPIFGKHGKIDPVGTDEIDPVKTA